MNNSIFENIKHIDNYGNEYWSARELQLVLDYKEWRKFKGCIEKAKEACLNSNINVLTILSAPTKWLKQEIQLEI